MIASGGGTALARVALAGNPSDLYGGAVLAVTLEAWSAEALVAPARHVRVEPASRLVEATLRRFGRDFHPPQSRVWIRWRSSIPRTVGLGGSSALVIATARALCEHCLLSPGRDELAEFALSVETEELGITAGPQDRLAQAYGGLTYMDFSDGRPSCEPLDRALLPPVLIAWRPEPGGASGDVHAAARARPALGQSELKATVAGLADAARAARDALLAGDQAGFASAVDRTLDLRSRLMELDSASLDMARIARSCGAAANYTGSGGAIVAVATSADRLHDTANRLQALGCGVLLSVERYAPTGSSG